ncbi:lipid II flippase MurJ, partial [Bifidobacterium pseudocatenulatum]|nr:lipid II flippase MurJ [Bifidobacterium pseudocatenulatum]
IFGLRGIGLRAMGPGAAGSVGIVVSDQLANIVITRTSTNAPMLAQQQFGNNPLYVAGIASYQNANTIYM